MRRNPPPGFRWLVGGFALLAAIAFVVQWRSAGDRADLLLGVLCLIAAGYWLIFDRQPGPGDRAAAAGGGSAGPLESETSEATEAESQDDPG